MPFHRNHFRNTANNNLHVPKRNLTHQKCLKRQPSTARFTLNYPLCQYHVFRQTRSCFLHLFFLRPLVQAEHQGRGKPRNSWVWACKTRRVCPGLHVAVSGTSGSRRLCARPSAGIECAYRDQRWRVPSIGPCGNPRTASIRFWRQTGFHEGRRGMLRNSWVFL